MNMKKIISEFGAASVEVAEGLFTAVKGFCNLVGENPATDAILKGFGKVLKVARIHLDPTAKDRHDPVAAFANPALAY